jgi:hypothetical protein
MNVNMTYLPILSPDYSFFLLEIPLWGIEILMSAMKKCDGQQRKWSKEKTK